MVRRLSYLVACALFLFLVIAPCGQAFAQRETPSGNPLGGLRVFVQKGCIQCHSIRGEGGHSAPDLGYEQFRGGFLELATLMWNHFPKMKTAIRAAGKEIPVFDQQELADLFAYLLYISFLGEPGNEARGQALLNEKECLKCHVQGGTEVSSAPDLTRMTFLGSPIYLAQAMWNHGPQMQKKMDNLGIRRPSLSGEEMTDIAAHLQRVSQEALREEVYLYPGNPDAGLSVFVAKRCSECHFALAASGGDRSAPDLRHSNQLTTVAQIAATIWNHGGRMANRMAAKGIRWPTFTGEEMADLATYLLFLKFEDPAGDIDRGREVFSSHNCSRCHYLSEETDRGKRFRIRRPESPLTMVALMWNHAPRMDSLMQAVSISWPEIRPEDMTDLYRFLLTAAKDQHEE